MKRNFYKTFTLLLVLMLLSLMTSCFSYADASVNTVVSPGKTPLETDDTVSVVSGDFSVHYIDVGQGNAVLVQSANDFMLIDAGTAESSAAVQSYLSGAGVKTLSYVIATHPHEDHIGGMSAVLNNFDISKIIMPNKSAATKTFENFVDLILDKNIPAEEPSVGKTYSLGNAQFTVLAPSATEYSDLNDYSVAIRIVYKNTSFIFTGDATSVSEEEMLKNNLELSADVLMVAHHGSSSSNSKDFLYKVSPEYAIISVGKDNSYGHPTSTVLNRLTNAGIRVMRTDEEGTVIALSDGNNISFNSIKGDISIPEVSYIGNKNTKTFHYSWCTSVTQMKDDNKVTFTKRESCISEGYLPCNNCKP